MDYRGITEKFQSIVDNNEDRFYRELLRITCILEQTDDLKLRKVVVRYKKLLADFGDPFDYRNFEVRNGNQREEVIHLTVKLIDFLNDHFGFLKPLQ